MGNKTIDFAYKLLEKACDENRNRDSEIQQGINGEIKHASEVIIWTKKLTRKPTVALFTAALLHDVDRIVTPGVGDGFKGNRKSKKYLEHKKAHAKRSADYVCEKLKAYKVSKKIIKRVRFLIEHHDDQLDEIESYKDRELETLVAADTLSWFTTTGPTVYRTEGEKRAKDKLRFMIKKLPKFARNILIKLKVVDKNLNRLKNEILAELNI